MPCRVRQGAKIVEFAWTAHALQIENPIQERGVPAVAGKALRRGITILSFIRLSGFGFGYRFWLEFESVILCFGLLTVVRRSGGGVAGKRKLQIFWSLSLAHIEKKTFYITMRNPILDT